MVTNSQRIERRATTERAKTADSVPFADLRDKNGRLPNGFAIHFTAGKNTILAQKNGAKKPTASQQTLTEGKVDYIARGIIPKELQISVKPRLSRDNIGTLAGRGFSLSMSGPDGFRKMIEPGTYEIVSHHPGRGGPSFSLFAGGSNGWAASGRGTFTVHEVQFKGRDLLSFHVTFEINSAKRGAKREADTIRGEFVYEA